MIFSRVCASDKQDEPIGRQPDTLLQRLERDGIVTGKKLFGYAVRDDGNLITATLVQGPSSSAGFTLNSNGTFTYLPLANFNGVDSFTYRAFDGIDLSFELATVTLNISAVNDAPVANSLSATTTLNIALAATISGSDADGCAGQTFTYAITAQPLNGAVAPTTGSATCSNGILSAGVTYTPNIGFTGSNSFSFKLNDGTVDSASATMSVAVNP